MHDDTRARSHVYLEAFCNFEFSLNGNVDDKKRRMRATERIEGETFLPFITASRKDRERVNDVFTAVGPSLAPSRRASICHSVVQWRTNGA